MAKQPRGAHGARACSGSAPVGGGPTELPRCRPAQPAAPGASQPRLGPGSNPGARYYYPRVASEETDASEEEGTLPRWPSSRSTGLGLTPHFPTRDDASDPDRLSVLLDNFCY